MEIPLSRYAMMQIALSFSRLWSLSVSRSRLSSRASYLLSRRLPNSCEHAFEAVYRCDERVAPLERRRKKRGARRFARSTSEERRGDKEGDAS